MVVVLNEAKDLLVPLNLIYSPPTAPKLRSMPAATATYTHATPIGGLRLSATPHTLTGLAFTDDPPPPRDSAFLRSHALLAEACCQLDAYFAGTRRTFELPLAPHGTDFQRQVWAALQRIPYGATVSYSHIARTINAEKAVRAVGAANGANPIAVIIPCHRVIGANGALTGFGGGLPRKRYLLALERGDDLALAL